MREIHLDTVMKADGTTISWDGMIVAFLWPSIPEGEKNLIYDVEFGPSIIDNLSRHDHTIHFDNRRFRSVKAAEYYVLSAMNEYQELFGPGSEARPGAQ